MKRRAYLSVGAAVSAALAGCTSSSGDFSTPSSEGESQEGPKTTVEPEQTTTKSEPTTTEPESTATEAELESKKAEEHLEKAGTALGNAGDELSYESDKFTDSEFQDGGVDIDPTSINGYFGKAETELNAAEEYSNEEQKEKIEAARGYIELGKEMASFMDVFAEGYSQTYSGLTYFQSERYEDATEELRGAEDLLSEADDHLTVTTDLYEKLDTEVLDEMDQVEFESAGSSLEKLKGLIDAMEAMVRGIRFLSQGMTDLTAAQSSLEADSYSDAETTFRAASEDFGSAYSTFRTNEGSVPTEIKTTFIELTCYSKSLRDGSTHFANASEAIQNEDYERAEAEADKASAALDSCNFSSSEYSISRAY